MTVIIIGATGLLGQALTRQAGAFGHTPLGAARKGADVDLDIADETALRGFLEARPASLVINAAAITSLGACETDPGLADRINARASAIMAEACRSSATPFVQVSTDHYFTGDGAVLHDEDAPVCLVNEYARTKFAGEQMTLAYEGTLAVRTNFTGVRGWPDQPTFLEWAMDSLKARKQLSLFDDYFTSTIDADGLAVAIYELAAKDVRGLMNVASREAASKEAFVLEVARAAGIRADWTETASVRDLETPRAESLGLDVSRAEKALGRDLPTLNEVARNLVEHHRAVGKIAL